MKQLILLIASTMLMASCNRQSTTDETTANKQRMQDFYDQVMNAHNPAMLDSFCTADFVDHQLDPRFPKGIEGLRAAFTDYFTAYPDLQVITNFMMAKGDTVIAHITLKGTNTGPSMGMPPTNKQINVEGVDIVIIKDGKAAEHWGYMEEMKMMQQLGMMPPAGETGGSADHSQGNLPNDTARTHKPDSTNM